MPRRVLSPGLLFGALVALAGTAASLLAVNRALAQLPQLFRLCLGFSASLFPVYAGVRAYTSLSEVALSKWIRGGVALLILIAGHGGIVLVVARQAGVGPLALLIQAVRGQ